MTESERLGVPVQRGFQSGPQSFVGELSGRAGVTRLGVSVRAKVSALN